ncbi:MAG TPA: TetR/AcrR family transcriptional regulator [Marmoricola sp.]|nr:TetR/AcrR family transcriptional regulator [Marmoricola sp.]
MTAASTPHRPRVEGDREAEILDAALGLLLEVGYDRLTMDAVAKTARASKATLYRRWETKPALVIDALQRSRTAPHPEMPDTGTLRGDLLQLFCGAEGPAGAISTRVLAAVLTAISIDAEFAALFREKFVEPKIAITRGIYRRAVDRGEIDASVDLDVIGPALAGILLHRAYLLGEPPDAAAVERVVDHVILPAVRAAGATTGS